jgi:hypothetical protein
MLGKAGLLDMHDVFAAPRGIADEDYPAEDGRPVESHLLCHHAAQGETKHVTGLEAQAVEMPSVWLAISPTVSGTTLPDDRPSLALSNKITSRSLARGSVTAGSQLSSVPVKCCRHGGVNLDPHRSGGRRIVPCLTRRTWSEHQGCW